MTEKENLEAINSLRTKIKLNGKYLKPLTEDDLKRQAEETERRKRAEEERLIRERERLLGLVDGQVHKISEKTPEYEFSESDFSYDAEYDIDCTYYEYLSYYVVVYIGGDKSNPQIMKFSHCGTANQDETGWLCNGKLIPLGDNDCWEYSKEAFEKGFKGDS